MANGYTRVRPGDLITSIGFNEMLTALESLEARVTVLEGGTAAGGLAITGLHPPVGPYRIGDTLTVFGRGFEMSTGGTRVFLNTVRVLSFGAGSGDTQIVFVIPPVPGVVEPGTPVTLRVTNSAGQEVTREISLRPAPVILFGDVDVTWLGVNPTTIQPDQAATFQFRIRSRASAAADFLIDPVIAVATAQSVWQSRLQVLTNTLNPMPGRTIRLLQGQEEIFHVRITSVPSGTTGTPFTLTVTATSGGVLGTSGEQPFEVGETAETPDTTITLAPTSVFDAGTLSGDTLTMPVSRTARVRFTVTFQTAGRYDLTVTGPAAGTGWTVQRFPITPPFYEISEGDVTAGGGSVIRFPDITVTTGATPDASAAAQVRYQRTNPPNTASRSRTLNLAIG